MVEHQVLEERYVDKAKLIALLRRLFGDGKFEIEEVWQSTLEDMIVPALTSLHVQALDEQYHLTVPRLLTKVCFIMAQWCDSDDMLSQ